MGDRWEGELPHGTSMLLYPGWTTGWEQSGKLAGWSGDTRRAEAGAVSLCLDVIDHACSYLSEGPIQLLGAGPLASATGREIAEGVPRVLDLTGELLRVPGGFDLLPPESECVILVHPETSPQSFDFYSTIHRHSHRVQFLSWAVPRTHRQRATIELPVIRIGEAVPADVSWIWLSQTSR